MMLPITMPLHALRRIRELSVAAWPHEACGLLLGQPAGSGGRVLHALVMKNFHDQPARGYTIDAEDYLDAERTAQLRGQTVLGVWHSHPHGDPAPSDTDRELACHGWSYLIAGVTNEGLQALKCWRLRDGEFTEQPLVWTRP